MLSITLSYRGFSLIKCKCIPEVKMKSKISPSDLNPGSIFLTEVLHS